VRATIFLFVGLFIGGWLGWMAVSCATAAPAAIAPQLRSYAGACDEAALTAEELRALVDAELRYLPGDSPKHTLVVFRRDGERANLEMVEDGHYDDSVRGESRFFELRHESDGWRVLTCARDLRCYRGKSAQGLCN